jgi:mono/diheme cytochrome c family protein
MSAVARLVRLLTAAVAWSALMAAAQPPASTSAARGAEFAAANARLAAPAPAAPTGDRAVFVSYGCYQCHGYDGQGGETLRIAPTPYAFEEFAARVRKPANEMPAYASEVLGDADLQAIYRYLRSIAEPTADVESHL